MSRQQQRQQQQRAENVLKLHFDSTNVWVAYVLPMVKLEFVDKLPGVPLFLSAAYLDGDQPCVVINETMWDRIKDATKIDVLQHELSHLIMGHLGQILDLDSSKDRELLNICQDCAIHYATFDPTGLDEDANWQSFTYDKLGVPPLPPGLLFHLLKKRSNELSDAIDQALKDGRFVCQTGKIGKDGKSPEGQYDIIDSLIAQNALIKGLNKALGEGVKLPKELQEITRPNAGNTDGSRIFEFDYKEMGQWIYELLDKLQTCISKDRDLSYRRDPRMKLFDDILQKGRSRTWQKRRVVCRIDVSGSMTHEAINNAIAAIKDFVQKHKLEGTVALFDTKMSKELDISDFAGLENLSRNYGGGGTLFQNALKGLKADDIVVFFSDTWAYELKLNTSHIDQLPIIVTDTSPSQISEAVKSWDIIYIGG